MIVNLKSTDLINNIRNRLFLSDEKDITEEDIFKIKSLSLHRIGYGLKENYFDPNELKLFKNLENCDFSGINITDEIIDSLGSLENLINLEFDHCNIRTNKKLKNKIEKINILYSNLGLIDILESKKYLRFLLFQEIPETVDLKKLEAYTNLEKIQISNSNIINASILKKLKELKLLVLDGSSLDDESVLNNLGNIRVSKEADFFYRG